MRARWFRKVVESTVCLSRVLLWCCLSGESWLMGSWLYLRSSAALHSLPLNGKREASLTTLGRAEMAQRVGLALFAGSSLYSRAMD